MNTNHQASLWERNGNAVTELLWVVAALTIIIPILSIIFDANQTNPSQDMEGILVREMAVSDRGLKAIVNINKIHPKFDKKVNDPVLGRSDQIQEGEWDFRMMTQMAEQQEINPLLMTLPAARKSLRGSLVESPEEIMVADHGEWNIRKVEKLAEYYQMDPLLMALPAARKGLFGESGSFVKASFNRVQSPIQQGTVEAQAGSLIKAIPVVGIANPEEQPPGSGQPSGLGHSAVSDAEYQSAKDFVRSLIQQAYLEKGIKSEIFKDITGPAAD
jgi:hypothetical protein